MTIYLTSDLHFNLRGIIGHCNRPFTDIGAMNDAIVAGWKHIRPNDHVFVLGDFAYHTADGDKIHDLWVRLPGRKFLIVGNHDEQNVTVLKMPWVGIAWYRKLRHEGRRYILSHYPFETWEGMYRGYVHLHGHSHGTLKRVVANRFDVGVDTPDGFDPQPKPLEHWAAKATPAASTMEDL